MYLQIILFSSVHWYSKEASLLLLIVKERRQKSMNINIANTVESWNYEFPHPLSWCMVWFTMYLQMIFFCLHKCIQETQHSVSVR